jgi:hypothetical protein
LCRIVIEGDTGAWYCLVASLLSPQLMVLLCVLCS